MIKKVYLLDTPFIFLKGLKLKTMKKFIQNNFTTIVLVIALLPVISLLFVLYDKYP